MQERNHRHGGGSRKTSRVNTDDERLEYKRNMETENTDVERSEGGKAKWSKRGLCTLIFAQHVCE